MYGIIKQAVSNFGRDKCPRIAAALAYYAAFSLAPLLVLVISVAQLVIEPEDIRGRIEAEITQVVGESGAEQVKTMVETSGDEKERGILATGIGFAVILIGATGLFAQLQGAMNDVWEVRPDPRRGGIRNFLMKRLLSLGMVLTIAFLLVIALVVSAALHAFDEMLDSWLLGQSASLLLQAGDFAVSFSVVSLLFAAIFRVLPDANVAWRDVWVGAVTTAAMFVVGKFALATYLGSQNMTTTYGAAGSLVLILMWVYYSTLILLFGAEFTQAWAQRRGSGIRPSPGAVRIIQRAERLD